MITVLLTGVTGQIGSAYAPLLQAKGYRILYLIRSSGGKDAQIRLAEVLKNIRKDKDIALQGDVILPNCGIHELDIIRWRWEVDIIIHCAASVAFDESAGEKTRHTNIIGTHNMLRLADDLYCENFHHVSSTYISGSLNTFDEDQLDEGQLFLNPYAASKVEAEKLVQAWRGGKYTIHRLSIVTGDSRDGSVRTFHGYYGFLAPFWRMLKMYEEKWRVAEVECLNEGVRFDENGNLELPLFIDCSATAVLSLATVDWVVAIMAKLLEIPSTNQTLHLINPNPPKVLDAIGISLKLIGISGVIYDKENPDLSPALKRTQRAVTRGINKFAPYVTGETIFSDNNLRRVLGESYTPPPVFDEKLFKLMLDYAKEKNFGLAQ